MILEHSKFVTFKNGELLYKKWSRILSFFIILSGSVQIEKPADQTQAEDSADPEPKILGRFCRGTIIGEEWLYSDKYKRRMYQAVSKGTDQTEVLQVTANSL